MYPAIIQIILIAPFVMAFAILVGAPSRLSALIGTGVSLVLSVFLGANLFFEDDKSLQIVSTIRVLNSPNMSLSFGVDGVSVVLLFMSTLIAFIAVWIVPRSFTMRKWRYFCILLISAGAIGAFVCKDMLLYFAFHEIAIIPTFIMIGCFGYEDKKYAAWISTIFLACGSMLVLLGIIMLMQAYGQNTLSFQELSNLAKTDALPPVEVQKQIFLIFLIGFGILTALFPLHGWVLPTYRCAPISIVMLHASVMKSVGLYGLIRFVFPLLPDGAEYWRELILILVLGNILLLSFVALSKRSLDEILAYSSIIHIGYIYLGLAIGNELGLTGALFLLFSSGISVSMTFGLTGWLRRNIGGLDFDFFGGIGGPLPKTMLLYGFGVFALIGFPGIASFVGDSLIFMSVFQDYKESGEFGLVQAVGLCAIWGTVMMAILMIRAFHRTFMGKTKLEVSEVKEMTLRERAPYYLLALILVVVGAYPKIIINMLSF